MVMNAEGGQSPISYADFLAFGQYDKFVITVFFVSLPLFLTNFIFEAPEFDPAFVRLVGPISYFLTGGILLIPLFIVIRACGMKTYSPRFHRVPNQILCVISYLFLAGGLLAVFHVILSVVRQDDPLGLTTLELGFGFAIMVIYAILIAITIYFRVIAPTYENRERFDDKLIDFFDHLEDCERAIREKERRNEAFESFQSATEAVHNSLDPVIMEDERELKRDLADWLEEFETYQLPSKETVLPENRAPVSRANEKLNRSRRNFDSIRTRLNVLARNV